MSSQTVTNAGNNMLINKVDTSKIFLRDNRYQTGNTVNNSSYNPMAIPAGTIMGRISATGTLQPMYAPGADGTQFPVGILANDLSLGAGETKQATIVDFGDVDESLITFFWSGQTLDTVVSSRRVRDYLQAQGIKLISGTEMTAYDNPQ